MKIFHFKLDGDYVRSLEERNKLVEENINFVWFIIRRYFKVFISKYPYLQDDTFSEGCIGLCKAADYFDSKKGIEFTTFAAVCIKRSKIEDIQKITYLREKGYTQKEIGKILRTNQMTICRKLGKLKSEINILGK
ncbi:hypothetical protein ERM65_03620 [Clostridioides difficile]|nr:hypothetical protein [Clostridioides difficile]EGT4222278.1 hypothetical protein [Clostridioides difficile]